MVVCIGPICAKLVHSSKMALENSESFFWGMFARNETVFMNEKSRTTNGIPTLLLGMPPELLTIELHFRTSLLVFMSSFMCLLMRLFNCVRMCLVIYCIVIALCFSLNCVSLPCVLFLFMQLQSRYIRKNHLLSRSCYLFSFLLSFFLAFFLSFFHCLEFMPADLFGGGFA